MCFRYKILTAVSIRSTVFWNVTSRSPVGHRRSEELLLPSSRSKSKPSLLLGSISVSEDSEDRGTAFLRNVSELLLAYTT
jgi:hypothetical protein